jgi:hypothetical protein
MEIAATIVRRTQVGAGQRIMTAKNRLPFRENSEKRLPVSIFYRIRLAKHPAITATCL